MTNQSCILTGKPNDFFSFNPEVFSDALKFGKRALKNSDCFSDMHLPLFVFDNYELSGLEAIVKYIKEEISLSYREIAAMLNRDERTIWGAYLSSKKKMGQRFQIRHSRCYIPISILKDKGQDQFLMVLLRQ